MYVPSTALLFLILFIHRFVKPMSPLSCVISHDRAVENKETRSWTGFYYDLIQLILEGFRPLFMKLFFGKMENVMITIGLTNQFI